MSRTGSLPLIKRWDQSCRHDNHIILRETDKLFQVLLGQIEELRSIAARQGDTIDHLVRLVEAQHRKLGLDPSS